MIGQEAGCRHADRVYAYLNNLHRLGLIWFSRETIRDTQRYQLLEAQPAVVEAKAKGGASPHRPPQHRAHPIRRGLLRNLPAPRGTGSDRLAVPSRRARCGRARRGRSRAGPPAGFSGRCGSRRGSRRSCRRGRGTTRCRGRDAACRSRCGARSSSTRSPPGPRLRSRSRCATAPRCSRPPSRHLADRRRPSMRVEARVVVGGVLGEVGGDLLGVAAVQRRVIGADVVDI